MPRNAGREKGCIMACSERQFRDSTRGNAEVAQLVEQLIRNQQVTGSSPVFGSHRNSFAACASLGWDASGLHGCSFFARNIWD